MGPPLRFETTVRPSAFEPEITCGRTAATSMETIETMTRALSALLGLSLATAISLPLPVFAQSSDAAPTAPATTPSAPALGDGSDASTSPAPPAAATAPVASDGTPSSPEATAKAKVAAEALSPLVEDVQVVGPWSDGDKQGVWRTVMVQSPEAETRFHFFVQQLEGTGADLKMLSSSEISEINTIKGAVVGYRADEPSEDAPNSLTLFFDILPTDGEIAETYQLNYFPNAPYEFGPATN